VYAFREKILIFASPNIKIKYMKYTKSGFPFVRSPHDYLFALYKRNGYGNNFINAHYNSENETGNLHEIMWLLEKEEFIKVDYSLCEHNETLFKVRLTMKGFREVYSCIKDKKTSLYTAVSLVISFCALVISLLF
jgi:hypothetical protein